MTSLKRVLSDSFAITTPFSFSRNAIFAARIQTSKIPKYLTQVFPDEGLIVDIFLVCTDEFGLPSASEHFPVNTLLTSLPTVRHFGLLVQRAWERIALVLLRARGEGGRCTPISYMICAAPEGIKAFLVWSTDTCLRILPFGLKWGVGYILALSSRGKNAARQTPRKKKTRQNRAGDK